jgi:hypothetical protein
MAQSNNPSMPNGHKIDIRKLEKKVTSVSNALAKLSSAEDFRKLIIEWRRPGWTTPAEFIFVSAIVDSLAAHTAALTKLKGELIRGSKAVTGQ